MKRIYLLLFIFFIFQNSGIFAQDNNSGKIENLSLSYHIIELESQFLEKAGKIRLYLPADYSDENKYPVLYITDAVYNFEVALSYFNQLMISNSIPECILVGIDQQNREDELDIFWSENGIRFKNYIYNELIKYIDQKYSTSGFNVIIGHSDGAEYNHLLMLEKDNPFRGFLNISENLNNDVSDRISEFFENYNNNTLYYFIASAKYDSPDRIEAGEIIEGLYTDNKNNNIEFLHKMYMADHQNIFSKSLLDGIQFIFKDYRNLDNYSNFKEYTEKYEDDINKKYGLNLTPEEDDIDYYFGEILDNKDLEMYEYIIEYIKENDIFEILSYDRSWHYYYMGDYPQSIKYWNITLDNFEGTSPIIFYYNFPKAIDAYLKLNDPEGAIGFLNKCKKTLPEYALEFNYFIAKVSIENNINLKAGKQSLKYCYENYKENIYFNKDMLDKLNSK